MLGRLLIRFLVIGVLALIVGRALRSFFRGIKEGIAPKQPPATKTQKGQAMARDPVCGTFVVPGAALAVRAKSGMTYFCSDKCRQAFLSRG
jgi:YHS domain-containing protein